MLSGARLTVDPMVEQMCPRCDDVVEMRHGGTEQQQNEFTSPWKFVNHMRDTVRGGVLVGSEPCPGSGRNLATARSSL